MGRPPLRPGTHGSVNVQETSPGRFRARTRFRDDDGQVRFVVRYGASPNQAEQELQEALKRRRPPAAGGDITGATRLRTLADAWIASVERDTRRAPATRDRYGWIVRRVIVPDIGELLVRECDAGRLDRFIDRVVADRGPATARTTRACLSMMLGLAVRRGALPSNPCRDLSPHSTTASPAVALTVQDAARLVEKLGKDRLSREHDLVDLVAFLLGSGCRIGEACALRVPDVDLDAGTAEIKATVTDRGLQEHTKSKAGHRVIALPGHVVAMLRRRVEDPTIRTDIALFPSPLGHMRDSSNTASHLRRAFDRVGYPQVHSHTLRKSAATRLDEAGLSPREIADHLGHSRPSMTLDNYVGRKIATSKAAEALAVP